MNYIIVFIPRDQISIIYKRQIEIGREKEKKRKKRDETIKLIKNRNEMYRLIPVAFYGHQCTEN